MKYLLILLFLVFNKCQSQELIKPLHIGDTVPNIKFQPINSGGQSFNLYDYKGKLIILDFWTTWCGICKRGFLKGDTLTRLFGDKLEIILVNSKNRTENPDSREDLDSFYSMWMEKFPKFSLRFAIEDSIAYSLFPNIAVPHYAWIDSNMRVIAITSISVVTEGNIKKYLLGEGLTLPIKDDLERRKEKTHKNTK
jgi:thiol-disulfide isomerase/thioredoxin